MEKGVGKGFGVAVGAGDGVAMGEAVNTGDVSGADTSVEAAHPDNSNGKRTAAAKNTIFFIWRYDSISFAFEQYAIASPIPPTGISFAPEFWGLCKFFGTRIVS